MQRRPLVPEYWREICRHIYNSKNLSNVTLNNNQTKLWRLFRRNLKHCRRGVQSKKNPECPAQENGFLKRVKKDYKEFFFQLMYNILNEHSVIQLFGNLKRCFLRLNFLWTNTKGFLFIKRYESIRLNIPIQERVSMT